MNLSPIAKQINSFKHQSLTGIGDKKLQAVMRFFNTLNQEGIRYCHWKSNSRLDWGLEGRTDLDLLVDSEHEQPFKQLLRHQGIKHLLAPAWKQFPGLEHYLGFDSQTGRLFHLHVHFALVLGEQRVKNYSLPLENAFLDTTRFISGVKVPPVELELIVLCLRALLKYRDRDVIKDFFTIRSPGIPKHILDEIIWLLDQTTFERIEATLSALHPIVQPDIVLKFLKTIQNNPRDGRILLQLRSNVRKILRSYQRSSRFAASLNYFKQLIYKLFVQRSKPDQQLLLPSGGLMIALIGVDGSGKSTLSTALTDWLSWKVDTPFYYLGSKQPSLWTKWSYILFRVARRSHTEFSAKFSKDNLVAEVLVNLRQILLAAHYLFVGYDRIKRYQSAKRKAANGSVVIFDRFPFHAPLDGPEIFLIDDGSLNPVSLYLSRIEQNLYQRFEPVDLLILLNVDPMISIQRKPDHSLKTIQAKNTAMDLVQSGLAQRVGEWNWISIDAGHPFEDVLLRAKKLVWTSL